MIRFSTEVSDACSLPLLKNAPGKYVFLMKTASDSEIDHVNRISCLKVGVLVHRVSGLFECQGHLAITYSRVASLL